MPETEADRIASQARSPIDARFSHLDDVHAANLGYAVRAANEVRGRQIVFTQEPEKGGLISVSITGLNEIAERGYLQRVAGRIDSARHWHRNQELEAFLLEQAKIAVDELWGKEVKN